jgi:hypothetical protein
MVVLVMPIPHILVRLLIKVSKIDIQDFQNNQTLFDIAKAIKDGLIGG